MNALSWMIYLADVAESVANAMGFFGFMGLLAGAGLIAASIVPWHRYSFDDDDEYAAKMAARKACGKWGRFVAALCAAMLLLSGLTPSSRTIYLIAASEAGETVVTSPDTTEMFGDLKAIIKKRLKEELAD